jgi:putative tributyrin esterase
MSGMALLHTHFFSRLLGMHCMLDAIVPQQPAVPESPVLWLLHGLSDDHSIWQRRTSIERYAEPLGLAVIMPNVHRSFYTDMRHGYPYESFVAEELPAVVRGLFRLSPRREDNFVAGLSMGGYGAFKLALNHPQRYAAAASLSGALDVAARRRRSEATEEMEMIFGGDPAGTRHDLFRAAELLAAGPAPRPRLFQWCGTEDSLLADNRAFRDHARRLGLDLTYAEGPGGHEWGCWDAHIRDVLAWLPLARGGGGTA